MGENRIGMLRTMKGKPMSAEDRAREACDAGLAARIASHYRKGRIDRADYEAGYLAAHASMEAEIERPPEWADQRLIDELTEIVTSGRIHDAKSHSIACIALNAVLRALNPEKTHATALAAQPVRRSVEEIASIIFDNLEVELDHVGDDPIPVLGDTTPAARAILALIYAEADHA